MRLGHRTKIENFRHAQHLQQGEHHAGDDQQAPGFAEFAGAKQLVHINRQHSGDDAEGKGKKR